MKRAPWDLSKSGTLEEVPLEDLLTLCATSRMFHVLVVRAKSGVVGEVRLRKGFVFHASIDGLEDQSVRESLLRMLTWQEGHFRLDPLDDREFPDETSIDVNEIIAESRRARDELAR